MSLATLLNTDAIRNFLQDPDVYDALVEIAEKHKLPDERVSEFLDLTDAVLDGQLPLADVPTMLGEAFGTDEAASRVLAVEITGTRLLPLEIFFPGVGDQIKEWGGDVAAFGVFRVQKEGVLAEDLAEKVAAKAGVSFSELLMKRLAFLLEQRVNEQKTDESLRTFFGRPLTIGGMGLAKDQIDALMTAVTEAVDGVRIMSEEERIEAAKEQVETEKKRMAIADNEQKEVDEETDVTDGEMMVPPDSTSQEQVIKTDKAENKPITALEIPPSHEVAAEVPVISSPERHIEPAAVIQPKPAPVVAPQVKKIAEPPMVESPDAQSKKKAEKAKRMQDEALKTAFSEAVDIALEKAHASLDEAKISSAAFADVAGKMLRGIRDQYQTRDVLERDFNLKGAALSSVMQALLEAEGAYRVATDSLVKIEDMDTHLSEEDATELEEQEATRVDAKFTDLTKKTSKPAPAKVELTVGSIAPAGGDGMQKKVTDVVAGNRLMGPVEQLGTMTLADFRRLSTNPDEAVRKMEALLLALQKTSYEDRVRGVLAWRKSPLAGLSIALMTESLNTGVAVAEIAARRRSQGKETLGPAEMQALSKWNEKVRF